MKKIVIVSVTNDLTSDKRVDRVCNTLTGMGFEVILTGRKRRESLPVEPRKYRTRRMHLLFSKGPLFYATYNLRLLIHLLFSKVDLLVSNDLDTLPANYLASKIKRIPLVHDCHEYFRGVPELIGRPFPVRIWKKIEDRIFPNLKSVYAVNSSIAKFYSDEYKIPVEVIRNVPVRNPDNMTKNHSLLNLPEGNRIILYQGSVNMGRGLEEAILAMKFIKTKSTLVIIGTGDVLKKLKGLVGEAGVSDKVKFTGEIPFQKLTQYTILADIGLSIEKDTGINYHFCLPNKFLDYIQSGVPVLVSPLPEMKQIVEKYQIGEMIESHDPEHLAKKFDAMLTNNARLDQYKKNLEQAAADLCWENEEKKLKDIFAPYA